MLEGGHPGDGVPVLLELRRDAPGPVREEVLQEEERLVGLLDALPCHARAPEPARRLCRMPAIRTYSSISNACRAMSPIVLTLGGDASPFVASSVMLHQVIIRHQGGRHGSRDTEKGSETHSCVGVTSVSASRAERILPVR